MTRAKRMELINEIEKMTDSKVIVLILGDRRGMETKIANDVLPFCLEHLSRFKQPKRITLFLYSTGGITMAGYSLANLLLEFSETYDVIVPFKALSCATLITLGANQIFMTKMGQLSPIDPSINSPLAPTVSIPGTQAGRPVPVNVEDVINYIELAKNELGIKDEDLLTRLYDRMSQNVHPLVLGAVYRSREQIGFLAQMLLERHLKDGEKIQNIIEILTRGRFSHDYTIGRKEAKEILQLPIMDVPPELDNSIVRLYLQYDELLQLSVPYHPEQILRGETKGKANLDRGIVETEGFTHVFRTVQEVSKTVLKPPIVPQPQEAYLEKKLSECWELDNTI